MQCTVYWNQALLVILIETALNCDKFNSFDGTVWTLKSIKYIPQALLILPYLNQLEYIKIELNSVDSAF